MANLRETAEMMTSVRDELTGMVEEAVKYTSEAWKNRQTGYQKAA